MNNKNYKVIGIYGIEDKDTGNVYVGQSKDIAKRWSNHTARLKNGNYRYTELQDAYNLDCSRIKYTILEVCTEEMLQEREDYWIKNVGRIDGWHLINKQKFGGASKKVKDTSNMCKAQTGENNGHNTKLTVEDVIKIKNMLNKGCKTKTLAEQFGVSNTLIYNIKNGHRWKSVVV